MASIKVKYRPSATNGKEGSIYYQVIHRRTVRQIGTDFRVFDAEWNKEASSVRIMPKPARTGNGISTALRNTSVGTSGVCRPSSHNATGKAENTPQIIS